MDLWNVITGIAAFLVGCAMTELELRLIRVMARRVRRKLNVAEAMAALFVSLAAGGSALVLLSATGALPFMIAAAAALGVVAVRLARREL